MSSTSTQSPLNKDTLKEWASGSDLKNDKGIFSSLVTDYSKLTRASLLQLQRSSEFMLLTQICNYASLHKYAFLLHFPWSFSGPQAFASCVYLWIL